MLSNMFGGNPGPGGFMGMNWSGIFGNIFGKSDDPQRATRTSAFFEDLHKLLHHVLTESGSMEDTKYLARTLIGKIQGGGFCDLKPDNSYGKEFGKHSNFLQLM